MSYDLGPGATDFEFNERLSPLESALSGVDRPGSFYSCGFFEARVFDPRVSGVGRIALPISAEQAKRIAAAGERAPYGRGAETILDTKARKVWQLPPEMVSLAGKAWQSIFSAILQAACSELGVDAAETRADLYKLLVYDKGSFFKPHRDTEKADGMFGTLSVILPSAHAGGQLVVRHQGEEIVLDLCSEDCSEIAYAAFYADCEHEIWPVLSGARVALIYNLSRAKPRRLGNEKALAAPDRKAAVDAAAACLDAWRLSQARAAKIVYFLQHYYTEAELAFDRLKGADDAVARTLAIAARKAGCELHLALVSLEESGAAEYWSESGGGYGSRRYWDDDEEEDDEEEDDDEDVGEADYEAATIDDARREARVWVNQDDERVALGSVPIADDEMLPRGALKNVKPDSHRVTEATGNEGASYERSYCKAALVIWARGEEFRVLLQGRLMRAVERLAQLVDAPGSDLGGEARERVRALADAVIEKWAQIRIGWYPFSDDEPDARLAHGALNRLGDRDLIARFLREVVPVAYDEALNESIVASGALLDSEPFGAALAELFERCAATALPALARLLGALEERHAKPKAGRAMLARAARALIVGLPRKSPPAARYGRRGDSPAVDAAICSEILTTSGRIDPDLVPVAVEAILERPACFALDTVVAPAAALAAKSLGDDPAFQDLWAASIQHLLARSSSPPGAPKDWSQMAGSGCGCADCLALAAFARDPLERERRFRVRKDRRRHLHEQIDIQNLAMTHETERTGSPMTLVCRKTRRDYDARCRRYRDDLASLKAFSAAPASASPRLSPLRERAFAALAASAAWIPARDASW